MTGAAAPSAHIDNAATWQMKNAPTKFEAVFQELEVRCVYVPFIGDISMAESKFSARVDLDVAWIATQDDLRSFKRDPHAYLPSFVPDLVSKNGMGVSVSRVPGRNGNEYQIMGGKNFMRVRFEGSFIEAFEMESFPFDVQSLTFVFGISFFNAKELRFTRPADGSAFFYVLTRYSAFLEWIPARLIAGIPVFEDFSTLVCQVQLKRDPVPYVLRIGVPCLLLNVLQFSIFTSPEAAERVNLILTIILTYVALLYTLTSLVPMAARTTIADSYMFSSIAVAVFTIGLAIFATYAPEGPDGPIVPGLGLSADELAIIIACILQLVMHVRVAAKVISARRMEAAKLELNFDELYLRQAESSPTMQY